MTLVHDLRRRRLTGTIAVAALLVELILQGVFVVRVLDTGHRNEKAAHEREVEFKAKIAELQATQSASTSVTECARKLNAAYVLADNDARHLWNTFVTDPALDREKAKKDLAAADAIQFAAAKAVDAFAHLPILPCPTP